VEPPPTVEAPGETSGTPGMAYRINTKAEELWGGNWRKLLATPAVLVCVALLLVVVLGAAVWRLRNRPSRRTRTPLPSRKIRASRKTRTHLPRCWRVSQPPNRATIIQP